MRLALAREGFLQVFMSAWHGDLLCGGVDRVVDGVPFVMGPSALRGVCLDLPFAVALFEQVVFERFETEGLAVHQALFDGAGFDGQALATWPLSRLQSASLRARRDVAGSP